MKKIISFLLTAVISFSAFSQLLKENIYEVGGNNYLGDMIRTADNNILLCAYDSSQILMIKTDFTGEVIWQKAYDWEGVKRINQISENGNGEFVVGGKYLHYGLLYKINNTGDTLWRKLIENTPDLPLEITTVNCLSDGNVLISVMHDYSNYNNPPVSGFSIYDGSGEFIYSVGNFDGRIEQAEIISDSSFLFAGSQWLSPSAGTSLVIKTFSGNSIDYEVFNSFYSNSFDIDEAGNIYLTVNAVSDLLKTNDIHSIAWETTIFPNKYKYMNQLQLSDDMIYTSGGLVESPGSQENIKLFLLTMDLSGQNSKYIIDSTYFNQIGKKLIVKDDEIIVAGNVKTDIDSQYDVFLNVYSADSLLISVESKKINLDKTLLVYPNPAKNAVRFNSPLLPKQTNSMLEIHDIHGKRVASLPISSTLITWDTSRIPNGIYFYKTVLDGEVVSGKIIIRK
ncbi:MAG TPA: T9SS type A sorting domain-containing protein [Bacteroidales bacterium]|nr:T9SS type A sorting domain-containing protein [Bacteroidales bacterium]HRX97510.1 T9SS type A sorting domain-containing protein [Bacteroidales bacterium]